MDRDFPLLHPFPRRAQESSDALSSPLAGLFWTVVAQLALGALWILLWRIDGAETFTRAKALNMVILSTDVVVLGLSTFFTMRLRNAAHDFVTRALLTVAFAAFGLQAVFSALDLHDIHADRFGASWLGAQFWMAFCGWPVVGFALTRAAGVRRFSAPMWALVISIIAVVAWAALNSIYVPLFSAGRGYVSWPWVHSHFHLAVALAKPTFLALFLGLCLRSVSSRAELEASH
jgi:hypothetical protein